MFRKILIANRGEIAVRVIRTCRQMGIKTVAIYSEADKELLHVKLADESFCVGPAPSVKSYLNIPNIISAALVSEADAIHPGYGFLSENVHFAEVCESHGIQLIGPASKTMGLLGDKSAARELAKKLNVPVIPGSTPISSVKEGLNEADKIGFPVMIKATAGGGGKGMRLVFTPAEMEKNFSLAQSEADSAFGDSRVYLEKYLVEPRHIEVQILGDSMGKIIALPERECSLQRKHQKVMEESPSVAVTETDRKSIKEWAIRIGREVHYVGAGTIEFLRNQDGKFYFIEANARIQVEHPVTEMITELDLVQEQIHASQGEPLSIPQENIEPRGHAIECRINAEDSDSFAPSVGTVEKLHWPGGLGIRVDSHIRQGEKITPFYDNLLGKIIARGKNREQAFARMQVAIHECQIEGIKTNLSLHRRLLENPEVRAGRIHVSFLEGTKVS